ncbi:MAG TPA: YiaA/YiaB family inner membrane protein [Marmoricola sp.]|nr:YiaA/YiaB family inner membrane protein [Marmoricola sp.]
MDTPPVSRTTAAFYLQSVVAFGIALSAMVIGVWFLPVNGWIRGFLCLGTLFLVSSAFTLAKVIRDQQEAGAIHSRIDHARVEKILAEHDPFAT